jgi:large subunit ribosomal protein L2
MLKKTKPITNSLRTMKLIDYKSVLSGDKPLKSLLRPLVKSGGRNNQGKVTAGHRGGGAKRQYRIVDFKRNLDGVSGKIKSIEYDPNRSSFLSLVHYQNGVKKYILAINNLSIGSMIISGVKTTLEIGNALELRHIQTGTIIHNVELKPGKGAQIVRSAGAYAEVLSHDARYTILKLPSGETRKILGTCRATVGRISNEEHNLINFGQAGKSR